MKKDWSEYYKITKNKLPSKLLVKALDYVKIKNSLVKEGIFCGQLFGIHDQWNNRVEMIFHTKEQAERLFSDMEIISFEEEEKDGTIADGTPKHWHIFHFIPRKKKV